MKYKNIISDSLGTRNIKTGEEFCQICYASGDGLHLIIDGRHCQFHHDSIEFKKEVKEKYE